MAYPAGLFHKKTRAMETARLHTRKSYMFKILFTCMPTAGTSGRGFFFRIVTLPELFNTSGCVNKTLFPGKKRMAVRANFQLLLRLGAAYIVHRATGTGNPGHLVVWMSIFFHLKLLVCSAGAGPKPGCTGTQRCFPGQEIRTADISNVGSTLSQTSYFEKSCRRLWPPP